ncbi:hypothetical protein HZH66_004624 [Vespula vulgaris]|uniref:Uncharacterized protein n=1 Tax=Vespula vulgaris TaxID=7454 RepID=A0A834KAH4_VESVU|nr:hypothetical protein HZH66_004624 [Vespula vulgaris]
MQQPPRGEIWVGSRTEVEEIWLVSEKQEDLGFHSNNIALSTDLTPTLVVTQTRTKKMKCTIFKIESHFSHERNNTNDHGIDVGFEVAFRYLHFIKSDGVWRQKVHKSRFADITKRLQSGVDADVQRCGAISSNGNASCLTQAPLNDRLGENILKVPLVAVYQSSRQHGVMKS